MSEKQRLITKYVTRLSLPATTNFYLHFLISEDDSSARHMLIDSLNQIAEETGNINVSKCAKAAENGMMPFIFGVHQEKEKKKKDINKKNDKEEQNIEKDYLLKGTTLFQKLCLEDALTSFKKGNFHNHYLNDKVQRMRAEAHLILHNYGESFHLARKFHFRDILFASAISLCQFEFAHSMLEQILNNLSQLQQQRDTVISFYDLIHLVMIVSFTTSTTIQASSVAKRLFAASDFETPIIENLANDFINREFSKFIGEIDQLLAILSYSVYTCDNATEIMQAIRANVITNYVRPLSTVSFTKISNDLSSNETEILAVLRDKIGTNKLNGKVDLVNNCYNGGSGNQQFLENQETYDSAIALHEKFQLNQWKKEYK